MAFVGRRLHHGMLPLRGICVANADGTGAAPLPHTVCARECTTDLIEYSTQLFWVQPDLLLYGDDYRIFAIPVGGKPKQLGPDKRSSMETFSVDAAGDRLAAGYSSCVQCSGPVTVLDVPSGELVGRIGGKKVDNVTPSISPDGKRVVFVRYTSGDSPHRLGMWIARADGSHLRRIVKGGAEPSWSPDGKAIAYLAKPPQWGTLRLVPPRGGKGRTLVARGVWALFGWSPDGTKIAFTFGKRLAVVDVATGKVRGLMRLRFNWSADWSPDSKALLVGTQLHRKDQCLSVWRVSVGGGKKQLLRNC